MLNMTQVFQEMPQYDLAIPGKIITFLVDSGTTHSVIESKEFPASPKISGSVGASGNVVREHFTVPFRCVDDAGKFFKHAFLLSDCCPINLLSRELMCLLGIELILKLFDIIHNHYLHFDSVYNLKV